MYSNQITMAKILMARIPSDFLTESWPDLLEGVGHIVREVTTTQEALDSLDFHPDLVLCELYLPDLNCFELARRLKTNPQYGPYALTPVIGFGIQEHRLQGEDELLVRHYLQTPASPYRLLECIDNVVSEPIQ